VVGKFGYCLPKWSVKVIENKLHFGEGWSVMLLACDFSGVVLRFALHISPACVKQKHFLFAVLALPRDFSQLAWTTAIHFI